MKRLLVVLAGVMLCTGCYYDKANELYPAVTVTCDTASVGFAKDILPIMQQKCGTSNCHDASTKQNGYDLSGFTGTKLAVEDGKLLHVIRWDPGYKPMPEGMPKLDDCSINKITRWVNQGAQNN